MPEKLQLLIDRVGGRQRAMMIAAGVVLSLAIFGLARWATAPTWAPVLSNVPLETVGAVTQRLEEEGIPFRLEGEGAQVLVASSDLARARVLLAQGGLPQSGRPGLELFDQPSWGMTDFTQRINYRRALEGELERTIGEMRGVEAAKVHLALHESASFRRPDRPAEASVVLKLRGSTSPGQDVVQGIAHLVASSVDGLKSEDVTVLDDSGRLLSIPNEPGSLAGLTHRQLTVQREVERHLQLKAEELLHQVVGRGNTRVQVNAEINFDRIERTVQSVDPEQQALVSEQRAEIVPGPEGGAGSSNVANSYENSRKVESFSGAIGNVKRLTVAVLVNDRKVGSPDAPEYQTRSPEELQQLQALVTNSIGLDPARGDGISVVSTRFDGGIEDFAGEEGMTPMEMFETAQRPLITLIALLLAFFVALRVIRTIRPEQPDAVVALPVEEESVDMLPEPEEMGAIAPAPLVPAIPAVNPAVREAVTAGVNERTDEAVRLAKLWLKES